MTIKELKQIISNLPDDALVYYKNYNVAGYCEDMDEVRSTTFDVPYKCYPEIETKCLILDCYDPKKGPDEI